MGKEGGDRNWRRAMLAGWVIIVNVCILEALSFFVYKVNPFHIFNDLYYDTIFPGQKMPTKPYGWDSYSGVRDTPSREPEDCGAAFGDSFTWGDEVNDAQAWPYIASQALGCNVVNYGVGGFGSDQAYIKYETINPNARFVIFGVYREMLRRNFAASWAFYISRTQSTIKPMFVLRGDSIVQPPLPATNSIEDIRRYHENDRYYFPFRIRFPYSVSLLKVLYYHLNRSAFDRRMLFADYFTDPDSVRLESLILAKVKELAARNGSKLALLFFPFPKEAEAAVYPYGDFMRHFASQNPDVCMIDPGPALTKAHRGNG